VGSSPTWSAMEWFEKCEDAVHDDKNIKGFFGDYRWLSNFHPCDVMWKGLMFKSSEAAYQAAKSLDPKEWVRFSQMSASVSKREGRKTDIREDWDDVKVGIMTDILMDKFLRNKDLRDKLMETGEKYLEETNWWKDKFWGVYQGVGQNYLGLVLMEVRNKLIKLRDENKLELFD
jgi:ribA/ribD-fused uncharacterized protein